MSARLPSIPLGESPELFLYLQAKRLGISLDGDPIASVLGNDEAEMARAAVARLPDSYRVVAVLHFLSGETYAECAETLGIAPGTVRSRLHRARKLLQVTLWQIAEERGYVPKREIE